MKTTRELLERKGTQVWTIAPEASVYEALALMAEKNIGAVLVMERGRLIGIISERDYTRNVALQGRTSRASQVRDIMTPRPVCVTPEQTIDECMALMTDKRVRHLPVIEDGSVIGLVSIGDAVKEIISEQQFLIDQLERYIAS